MDPVVIIVRIVKEQVGTEPHSGTLGGLLMGTKPGSSAS